MDIRKNGYLTIISPITRNPSYMSKKGFSILHTLSVGDEDTKNLEDFSFLIDQWKRHNRNRRIFNRRINQIQLATDQQQMPYISENIRHSTTDDESEDEEEIPTNFDTLKNIQDDSNDQLTQSSQNDEVSIEIPPFALINQRNFPLIHIHRSHISQSGSLQYGHSHMQSVQHAHAQNPIHTQANQQGYRQNFQQISNTVNSSNQVMNNSNSYFQQQQQQQQQIRTNYIPRAYSTNQMQYTTATPSSSTPQPQQDESNNTIQYESFFIHSKHEQNTQQQQRAENDNRFLAMTQNQSLNPLRQINQISSQIPSTISSLGSQLNSLNNLNINGNLNSNLSSHMGNNMSNNINSNLNNTMNYLLQNRSVNIYNMMRSSTNMYQSSQPLQKHISTNQQQNQPQIIKTYFNQYAENSQWSVIWDPDQCPNIPLILDRSDRRIKFTDVNSHGNDQKRKIRKWDDMNFENKSYYSELFVSKDSRLDLNLRHSDPALNLSLIEPNLTDFENFHHPKFNTVPFISHKLKVTYKMEYDIGENGEAAISPFLKDLKSLSGRRGGIVIVEHTSEALPFIMNVGMASRLIIYWHKATPNDNPKTNVENMHILEPDQTAPFIAQIPRNESVPSINCLLYSVPVAEHKVEMTDFLLIKSVRKPIFYIRKFKSIYCAGFLEPHQVVMRPATKTAQDFHLVFIKAILINIFRGTE
ncbi:hypothetical protein TRFO_18629 [Tritrichomonas foetus]|uniref:Transcription initiation factor TFIID subunit 1 histone acetyltransferase domain-containing protein n=1 Tax=Tritrichomonas foetus TaxID=1144522 RepID=A0A1J4KQ59_9EUKA|nr:hypothetical protein TRFO_18629 [Tritrichomonas foetus]|eukprot:OHT11830.1 hypothetical protein TRFO_18629 [Tritrichomonas foetus]